MRTAYEMGWSTLTNGDLLAGAESADSAAIVTTDKNVRHQQRIEDRRFGIVLLPTTDWSRIRRNAARVAAALEMVRPGAVVDVTFDA